MDRYTKIVLTVIALALSALVVENAVLPAQAQFGDACGNRLNPCVIRGDVFVTNYP